jgi:predicted amidohydrolase
MKRIRVAAVQMDSQDDKKANLGKATKLIEEAVSQGAQLVGLPEYFNFIGPESREFEEAETIPGPTTKFLSDIARKHNIWLHGGSILEKVEGHNKMFNTCTFFNTKGEMIAKYRKIHLFDVEVKGGPAMIESLTKESGGKVVVCETDLGRIGLSICYDMRFPELYRIMALQGATMMFVPSEYTLYTGKDHWEPILRARAIENQCFIIAPAQIGIKPLFQTYGRSLVIDPWGTVIAKAPDEETCILAELDMEYLERVRRQIPSLKNRKPAAYQWP